VAPVRMRQARTHRAAGGISNRTQLLGVIYELAAVSRRSGVANGRVQDCLHPDSSKSPTRRGGDIMRSRCRAKTHEDSPWCARRSLRPVQGDWRSARYHAAPEGGSPGMEVLLTRAFATTPTDASSPTSFDYAAPTWGRAPGYCTVCRGCHNTGRAGRAWHSIVPARYHRCRGTAPAWLRRHRLGASARYHAAPGVDSRVWEFSPTPFLTPPRAPYKLAIASTSHLRTVRPQTNC
jgi:hypothetical protein